MPTVQAARGQAGAAVTSGGGPMGLEEPMLSVPGLKAQLLQWHHLGLDLLQGHAQQKREAVGYGMIIVKVLKGYAHQKALWGRLRGRLEGWKLAGGERQL